eukprot:Mycagemm_TRINITY_DN8459_c0_g1::TRINITY_DN8459_c0_g1_i1::g.4590::m.4590 type:complete len:101 gc:universal TRINITY_DN8459_c0_g1_i1:817-515(-)
MRSLRQWRRGHHDKVASAVVVPRSIVRHAVLHANHSRVDVLHAKVPQCAVYQLALPFRVALPVVCGVAHHHTGLWEQVTDPDPALKTDTRDRIPGQHAAL